MYNEELENLIDAVLVDGELTEKEKQILFKKAQSYGIDLDEFEMVLNARLVKLKKKLNTEPVAPKSSKLGDVKKCPACGAIVGAFKTTCPECDYEFRDVEVNRSITELTNRINAVYEECDLKEKNGGYKIKGLERIRDTSSESERKEADIAKKLNNVISNFPVPNSREDIIELLQFIQPKVQVGFSSDKNAAAWQYKYIEIINRAKISYAKDTNMMSQIAYYEEASKQSIFSKLVTKFNSLSSQGKMLMIGIPLFIFLMIIVGIMAALEDKKPKRDESQINVETTDSIPQDTIHLSDAIDEVSNTIKESIDEAKSKIIIK